MSVIEKAAPVMTYGGGTSTVVFALNWNEIGVIVGILIGLVGLILQWYYKAREDGRAQALHDLQMILRKDRPDILGDRQTDK